MSKYIIDTETWANLFEVQRVGVYGIGNDIVTDEKTVWSRMFRLDELEELNSDYINENFGELQDEAYQKGFEDGKKHLANGCVGCQYEGDESRVNPCCECARVCDDHYIPKTSDRIEVGDEVIAPCGKAVVTLIETDDLVHYLYSGGDYGCIEPQKLKKTGKHYDIQSILEAMRK
jgi:hypothetical protein